MTTDLREQLRRLGRSRLGRFKAMADFDWAWPKRIDRPAVESAVQLDFLEEAHNVVLVAPQGLGKTMIAQNIAHSAVQAGHSVLFTTADRLVHHSEIISIEGKSYRAREAEEKKPRGRKPKA